MGGRSADKEEELGDLKRKNHKRDGITMINADIKKSFGSCELSNAARKAIENSRHELEIGQCKTFSSIDELFDDLDGD